MNRAFLVAGTKSGVGKTTITLGLLAALSKRMTVQGYKVGPDYIDPAYHTFITGKKCRNLDNFLMKDETVSFLFNKEMVHADIGVIEGAMGLYDGSLTDPTVGSAASISKLLNVPVILVVDGSGMALSAAAMVKGYLEFDPSVPIKGIIFNYVNSAHHYDLLKQMVEEHNDVTCYGYVPKNMPTFPSRHLGLVQSCEIDDLREKLELLGETISETVDIDGIIQLCDSYVTGNNEASDSTYIESIKSVLDENVLKESESSVLDENILRESESFVLNEKKVRIAVALDEAFSFYYADNLELLELLGAEIVPFSPMRDQSLPENIDFLYLGGGYPEQFAKVLGDNKAMKASVLEHLNKGIPYLAECGGFMYLCDTLTDLEGYSYKMVSWFEGSTTMTKKLRRFGYKTLRLQEDCILGCKDMTFNIHEFHHSDCYDMVSPKVYELSKKRKSGVKIEQCGYKKGNGIAGYPHIHFYGHQAIGSNIIKAAIDYKMCKKNEGSL